MSFGNLPRLQQAALIVRPLVLVLNVRIGPLTLDFKIQQLDVVTVGELLRALRCPSGYVVFRFCAISLVSRQDFCCLQLPAVLGEFFGLLPEVVLGSLPGTLLGSLPEVFLGAVMAVVL